MKIFKMGLVLAAFLALSSTAQAGLLKYVQKGDQVYSWKVKSEKNLGAGQVVHFKMTSQKWQGITWKHDLLLFIPRGVKKGDTAVILNTGGRPRAKYYFFAFAAAKKMQVPLAILFQVPNQPLFGGKKEDALIAETFVRFLKTKDSSWPLLFPMAKSVVRAMDTLEAYTSKKWKKKLEEFVITGSSKRGWTSWLTGAADKRVKAIAPMVIDTLNMSKQIDHQLKCYRGKVSYKLDDYEERGLIGFLYSKKKKGQARELLKLVDPYSYRKKLTLPKLMINGTNDPYWVVDALNLYWKGLKGKKYILYVPNAGHGLRERKAGGGRSMSRALNTLSAFSRHQALDKALPQLQWYHDEKGSHYRLRIESHPRPRAARIWISQSGKRDFRRARWTSKKIPLSKKGKITALITSPEKGYKAFYGELEYKIGNLTYTLSTQIRVVFAGVAGRAEKAVKRAPEVPAEKERGEKKGHDEGETIHRRQKGKREGS